METRVTASKVSVSTSALLFLKWQVFPCSKMSHSHVRVQSGHMQKVLSIGLDS